MSIHQVCVCVLSLRHHLSLLSSISSLHVGPTTWLAVRRANQTDARFPCVLHKQLVWWSVSGVSEQYLEPCGSAHVCGADQRVPNTFEESLDVSLSHAHREKAVVEAAESSDESSAA